jgi:hypothetical protein
MIGLPVKNNISYPIFAWQKEIFDALEKHKLISILKGRGVGATEQLLRYAFWRCVKDDKMQGKNMILITGIREDLSLELLRRYRNLLPDYDWRGPSNVAEINGCRLIGYPSKRVKDLRGLTDVSFVICDEFAFFDPADQQQILPVLEAFQAKSDPTICLLSTPGPLNDELHKIYQEPEEICRYHRLYIPIQKALGTLISEQEAEKVRRQGNYEQEFELRFGSYGVGTIFNLADIDFAVKVGKEYANPDYNPKAAKTPYPYMDSKNTEVFAIGCDPGFGLSKFGITMIALMDDRLHVLASEEHSQPDEDEMIERLLSLREKTKRPYQTKIYIDSANTPFIRRLKSCIPGERTDYENYMENELRKRKLVSLPDEAELVHYMAVVPVAFSKHGPKMLANLYAFLSRGDIAIHPKFTTLIAALQSARNVPNRNSQFVLDKSSQSMDVLDSLRLALFNLDAGAAAPDFETEEEKEGETEEEQEEEITAQR